MKNKILNKFILFFFICIFSLNVLTQIHSRKITPIQKRNMSKTNIQLDLNPSQIEKSINNMYINYSVPISILNYSIVSHNFLDNLSIITYDGYLNESDPEDIGIGMRGVAHAMTYLEKEKTFQISGYMNETELEWYGDLYYASKAVFFANYFLNPKMFYETNISITYPQEYLDGVNDAMVSSFILYLFLLVYDILMDFEIEALIYYYASQKILNSFAISINQPDGLSIFMNDNNWWFPHHNPQRFVLNGHISAVINLYNYYYRTSNDLALTFFNKGVNATFELIDNFFVDSEQLYDLVGGKANYKYQALHVMQLDWLYATTLKEKFKIFHDLFLGSYIISTGSEIVFEININKSFLEIDFRYIKNRLATGDNRLFSRGTMTFEGYYDNKSYLDVDMNIILRKELQKDIENGRNDPNSYPLIRRLSLNDTYVHNISDVDFEINYIYLQLPFNSYIINVANNKIYTNRYLEILYIVILGSFFLMIYMFIKKITDK